MKKVLLAASLFLGSYVMNAQATLYCSINEDGKWTQVVKEGKAGKKKLKRDKEKVFVGMKEALAGKKDLEEIAHKWTMKEKESEGTIFKKGNLYCADKKE